MGGRSNQLGVTQAAAKSGMVAARESKCVEKVPARQTRQNLKSGEMGERKPFGGRKWNFCKIFAVPMK